MPDLTNNEQGRVGQYSASRAARAAAKASKELGAWWSGSSFRPSFRYLLETEAHVYAFAIAANALLAFFPFTLSLLIITRYALHWDRVYNVVLQLARANLPKGAGFVVKGLMTLASAEKRIEIVTIVLLFYTSSGVFLPLEVAMNRIWKFGRNRDLLRNVLISFVLAIAAGLLALLSLGAASGIERAIGFLFGWLPGHWVVAALSRFTLELISVPLMIAIYFLIYYFLPHGKIGARRVLPAAILAGIATEIVKLIYFVTLPLFHFPSTYGPFAVPVTLLFWAYVGSMVLLWGAHFSAQVPSPQQPLPFSSTPGQATSEAPSAPPG